MKFSSNVITFLSIAVTAVAGAQTTSGEDEVDCVGEIVDTSTITALDILNSVVTKNELHLEGGELRYSDIGFVRDRPVDLVVTVVDGEYTDIAEVWADRGKLPDVQNGKKEDSQFANINLQTVKKKPHSGLGNFQFCFHDSETNALTTVDTFRWSVYDLDERQKDAKGIEERMFMDLSQAQSMQMWPTVEDSEIELGCEDGSVSLPCDAGIRTVFHSSTHGVGGDNPTDPNAMTDLQKKRSITFTFTDTDCWVFSYDHYCPGEQEDAERSYYCKSYAGGNFLFSGDSQEIHQDGECVVPPSPPPTAPPTNPPTTSTPTDEPTAVPTTSAPTTSAPTDAPTAAPTTSAPTTSSPTDAPTAAPTTSAPTNVPTAAPTTSAPSSTPSIGATTSTPTDEPTAAPTTSAPSTLSPTIKAVTRPPIITNGGDDDDDDLFYLPTCPADVKLIATRGSKDIDLERVVRIVSQDTSTVQVALNQGWEQEVGGSTANDIPSIDHVFYSYRTDIFDETCYEETSVMEDKRIDTVTIQCNVNKPFALLEICVVDDITNGLLSVQDDATIPKCCHPTFPPNTPTVCYTIEVNCVTECEDDDAMDGIDTTNNGIVSRGLRGGSP